MVRFILGLIIMVCSAGLLVAEETYTPPEGGGPMMAHKIVLQATKEGGNAAGAAVILYDMDMSNARIQLAVSGARAGGVYTVWFVNRPAGKDPEMIGVGPKPHMFKTNRDGKGRFVAALEEIPMARWQEIHIAYHPDDNPENMKNIVDVMIGKIPAERHVMRAPERRTSPSY